RGGVRRRRIDLEPVADDPRVDQQPALVGRAEARDATRVEPCERAAVGRALVKYRGPGQPRLGAFEDQHLEQVAIVARGVPPLLVVVLDHERVAGARPGTALLLFRHGQPLMSALASPTSWSANAATTSSAETQARPSRSGLSRRPENDSASAATKPPANPPACAQLFTAVMKK